jgi:hypothetical protein
VTKIQHNFGSHSARLITLALTRIQVPGLNSWIDGAKVAVLLGEWEDLCCSVGGRICVVV